MRLLAFVAASTGEALRSYLGAASVVTVVTNSNEFWRVLSSVHDAVLLDIRGIQAEFDAKGGAISQLELQALRAPLIILADESLHSLRHMISLARQLRFEIAIRRQDGTFDGLAEAVTTAGAAAIGLRVVAELRARVALVNGDPVARVLEDVFRFPSRYDLAFRTVAYHGLSPSILNAALKRHGLQPFHVLRRCARLAAAYALLRASPGRLRDVARRVGCGSVDSLERDAKLVAAMPPGRLTERLGENQLVSMLVNAATRPRLGSNAQAPELCGSDAANS